METRTSSPEPVDGFLGEGSPIGLSRLLLLADLSHPGRNRLAGLRDELFDTAWVRDPVAHPLSLAAEAVLARYAPHSYLGPVESPVFGVSHTALSVRRYDRRVRHDRLHCALALSFRPPQRMRAHTAGRAFDEAALYLPEWLVTVTGAEPDAWRRLDALSRTWRGSLSSLVATERSL